MLTVSLENGFDQKGCSRYDTELHIMVRLQFGRPEEFEYSVIVITPRSNLTWKSRMSNSKMAVFEIIRVRILDNI